MKILLIAIVTCAFATVAYADGTKNIEEAKGLEVGAMAPNFQAVDANNQAHSLKEALLDGPVVLIFYRGAWCPYCSRHLGQIQDSLKFITDKGASVIAITPEKPEYLEEMAGKTGATFTLLYDADYKIAQAFDVNFMPKELELFKYNTFSNANLKVTHSDDSQQLPIPATFIISQDGKISWRHFNPNYKIRSSVKSIIDNLPH